MNKSLRTILFFVSMIPICFAVSPAEAERGFPERPAIFPIPLSWIVQGEQYTPSRYYASSRPKLENAPLIPESYRSISWEVYVPSLYHATAPDR